MKGGGFRISMIATVVVVGAALGLGFVEDKRLMTLERRVESKRLEISSRREAEEKAAVAGRDEESKRSAAELMQWLKAFGKADNPHQPAGDEKSLAPMYERLDRITSAEAEFVLKEYLEGRGLNGFPGPLLFNLCMTKLATDRPFEAIELFSKFKAKWKDWQTLKEMETQVIGDAVIAMAKDNPDKTVEWLKENAKKFRAQISDHTSRVMLYHVAGSDPVKAFGLLGEMEMKGKEQAVASIVKAAKTDEERARMLSAFRSYESGLLGDERKVATEKAFGAFANQLSDQGVDAMARWVKAGNFSEDELNGVVGSVSSKYALRDPGPWIDWIGKSLSPEKADDHVRKIFSSWTESDYQEAGRWLVAMPSGTIREMAIQAYAEKAAKYDPQTAVQWVETLPKGQRRDEATRKVYDEWPVEEPVDVAAKEDFGKRNGLE